jgi:hypothetical protein
MFVANSRITLKTPDQHHRRYNSAVPTIVEHVENWYEKHLDRLKTQWAATSIRSNNSPHSILGKVEIRAESESVAASVTFWNSGNVTVLRLDLPAKRDSVIDDRKLSPVEDVEFLLDSYFRQLASPADR